MLLHNLAHVAHLRADHARAAELFRESIRIARRLGAANLAMLCVAGLAAVAASGISSAARAGRLFGIAEAMREANGWLMPTTDREAYERNIAEARARLGETAFATLLAEGRAMSRDEALDYALEPERERPPVSTPTAGSRAKSPLTTREQEVAALVARRLTNREIADQLKIAVGTARAHVDHILTKLALRSRAQLAVWTVQRGS